MRASLIAVGKVASVSTRTDLSGLSIVHPPFASRRTVYPGGRLLREVINGVSGVLRSLSDTA